jgi:hypothetical protein
MVADSPHESGLVSDHYQLSSVAYSELGHGAERPRTGPVGAVSLIIRPLLAADLVLRDACSLSHHPSDSPLVIGRIRSLCEHLGMADCKVRGRALAVPP